MNHISASQKYWDGIIIFTVSVLDDLLVISFELSCANFEALDLLVFSGQVLVVHTVHCAILEIFPICKVNFKGNFKESLGVLFELNE